MAELSSKNDDDFEVTADEVKRIGDALKNDEFRNLLLDYAKEVSDPESQRRYQSEMCELERERGNDVTFINPTPGYVVKTSQDGNKKCFINVCANEHVGKCVVNGSTRQGQHWSIPHLLAQPRDDLDKKNVRCTVYDVIFHPDTLKLARDNPKLQATLNQTACDSVEAKFHVKLDRNNLKYPRIQYKGVAKPTVIRKKIPGFVSEPSPNVADQVRAEPKKSPVKSKNDFTTPTYAIRYRKNVDIQDYTTTQSSCENVPSEILVDINLPLLRSTNDCVLDVDARSLTFVSEKSAKYKLTVKFPYAVHADNGHAKFDQTKRTLTVSMPVVRKTFVKYDSGVELDDSSPVSSPGSDAFEKFHLIEEIDRASEHSNGNSTTNQSHVDDPSPIKSFLKSDVNYTLPEFNCHKFANQFAFTIHVKNIDVFEKMIFAHGFSVQFTTISSGYFPAHYALTVAFDDAVFDTDTVNVEVWENNMIVELALIKDIDSYRCGVDLNDLKRVCLDVKSVTNHVNNVTDRLNVAYDYNDRDDEVKVCVQSNDQSSLEQNDASKLDGNERKSTSGKVKSEFSKRNVDWKKHHRGNSFSESSGDELSLASDGGRCPSKGILKRYGRSISESSIDETYSYISTSLDNYAFSDSNVHDEKNVGGDNLSKKTVRFDDNIKHQVFRINSSILGQKKKNQRKKMNKKRAQERRHSESELSETESNTDRKSRDFLRKSFSESELSEADDEKHARKEHVKKFNKSARKKRTGKEAISDKLQNGASAFKSELIFGLDM